MSLRSLGALCNTRLLHGNSSQTAPLSYYSPRPWAPWVTPGSCALPQLLQATASVVSVCALIKKQGAHPQRYSSHGAAKQAVQHISCATALLSWSHSLLAALSQATFSEDSKRHCLWVLDGFAHVCSLPAEMNSTKRNMLVASFCHVCWYLTHPGHACLPYGSLSCSCCLQHRTKTIMAAEVLQDYTQKVPILPPRFVSKARFEPPVSNPVRLEGTSSQKLFSHRVPQQRRGALLLLDSQPEVLSPEARPPDLCAKVGSEGSNVIWKHKRQSMKCQRDDLRDMSLHNREQGLGKEAALISQTSHCAVVTQALIEACVLAVLQVPHSVCFSRW